MGKKDKITEDRGPAPASPSGVRSTLGPLDIQQKEFRVSRFGGYKMRDVDEFLDAITESMSSLSAENDRLKAGAPSAIVGTPDLDDVARQADEIIKRARDEAERITAQAKVAAASGGGQQDRGAVNAFLSQEREFLQSLAGLVQGHAESVKAMSKAAKKGPETPLQAPTAVASRPATPASGAGPAPDRSKQDEPKRSNDRATAANAQMPAMPEAAAKAADDESTGAAERAREPEPTVRIEEPEPASVGRSDGDDDSASAEGDDSLRDLFWGED
jgi:DivIVA domain-containing protein